MIQIRELKKNFDDVCAVSGLSLNIPEGIRHKRSRENNHAPYFIWYSGGGWRRDYN